MFIHEATEKALRENCFICRKSAKKENMSVFGIIKPTNTYDICLLLIVKNGKIDKGSGWWNPTADDLMADDWEVLRDKSSYNLDKPKEREKAPRHVPENLIYHDRLSGREVNKRTIENFIKAGALDGLEGNRRQKMMIYGSLLDALNQEKKTTMAGQMTLFDIAPEEDKAEYEIKLPNVEEYDKEVLLGFEKEVLGIYISGHPLEEYMERLKKNTNAVTTDFVLDEETGTLKVSDGAKVCIGGMITDKVIKYTKNNKAMAFITLEDLVGTVEIIIFPKDYERYAKYLENDAKVFVEGRVTAEEDRNGKLICEKIISFDEVKRELWLQFPSKSDFEEKEGALYGKMMDADGSEHVVIYLAAEKQMKRLPENRNVAITKELLEDLGNFLGKDNVKVVEKSL